MSRKKAQKRKAKLRKVVEERRLMNDRYHFGAWVIIDHVVRGKAYNFYGPGKVTIIFEPEEV